MKQYVVNHRWKITVLALALLVVPFAAHGQELYPVEPQTQPAPQSAVPATAPPAYTQQQIDQMLAPIALYPDQLVAQILMAATYPLEVVEANRWLQNTSNAQLTGDQLSAALQQQPWDPSVKSLVNFPQVLAMMDNQIQWTEQLGDAFLAQQAQVMDSVQRLRQMAENANHLTSTPQQTVSTDDGAIAIQPANPQTVYVPYYDPSTVYGTWPYPDYAPDYFPEPGYYPFVSGLIGFGIGIAVLDDFWGWNHWDWRNHHIDIDDRRFADINNGRLPPVYGVWAHDPSHRHGVPYNSPAVRAQFQGAADAERRAFRGYAAQPAGVSGVRMARTTGTVRTNGVAAEPHTVQYSRMTPANTSSYRQQTVQQRPATAFESFARGPDVRAQSARGAYSRSTMAMPARSAPSVQRGGGGNNGGGRDQGGRIR